MSKYGFKMVNCDWWKVWRSYLDNIQYETHKGSIPILIFFISFIWRFFTMNILLMYIQVIPFGSPASLLKYNHFNYSQPTLIIFFYREKNWISFRVQINWYYLFLNCYYIHQQILWTKHSSHLYIDAGSLRKITIRPHCRL